MKYYSKKAGGFYTGDTDPSRLPDDAVEITDEYHQELMNGQSTGKIITSKADGYPILVGMPDNDWSDLVNGEWVENPERKAVAILAKNETRRDQLLKEAEALKNIVRDRILIGDSTTDDQQKLKKLNEYTDALRQIDLTEENIIWAKVIEL